MEQKIRRSEVEIMAPVGSYESLMAAIQAGTPVKECFSAPVTTMIF